MILADTHTHTSFSFDARESRDNEPENMLSEAIRLGLSHVAFTDHQDWEVDYGEEQFEAGEYMDALCPLREKYKAKIPLAVGVEIGLMPHLTEGYRAFTKEYAFDFVIGSVHTINGMDPYDRVYFENKTIDEAYSEAFRYTAACLRDDPDFDVLGHMDYVVRYGDMQNGEGFYARFREEIDEVLRLLIVQGKGLEINTCGLLHGMPQPNPSFEVVRRFRELGGEIVTAGSDTHGPRHLGYRIADAYELMREAGFTHTAVFAERKPEFLAI